MSEYKKVLIEQLQSGGVTRRISALILTIVSCKYVLKGDADNAILITLLSTVTVLLGAGVLKVIAQSKFTNTKID